MPPPTAPTVPALPWPRRPWLALLALLGLPGAIAPSLAMAAVPDAAGRWDGVAQIPGTPQRVVIDLEHEPSPGNAWAGSVILPGRGVKGAPLQALTVDDTGVRASLAAAFAMPAEPVPGLRLAWQADGSLAGTLQQGGHTAALALRRTGPPQVDRPVPDTPLSPGLIGRWVGRYTLGGAPREVTLTLANGPGGTGRGELVIVGQRRSTLVVDHVVQGRESLTLQASAAGLRIEGRWATADGAIDAQLVQGPFAAPLVLRRVAEGTP
ncbi:MAG: hypothetical protein KF891_07550 [Rhizobacter sp.]|nr:hypothetical protein [Rhizobacter sp.]